MRKYLGVLAGVAVLSVASWAQAPATPAQSSSQTPAQPSSPSSAPTGDQTSNQTSAQPSAQAPATEATPIPTSPTTKPVTPPLLFPRFEFFAGGTYGETGFFNAGHWAGLSGWDSSLGVNATSWIGVLIEGGQYFGTSKIPSGATAPFPGDQSYEPSPSPTFNVATREYNFLFGAQFARRKNGRWTPRGELLYGHQSARGVATPVTPGPQVTEIGPGRTIVVGGGVDHDINPRLALRLKADYFETNTAFPAQPKQKQDNFRFSVGIVFRNVHKKKRTLEEELPSE